MTMQKILILGPQGCGKGTQAAILSKNLGVPALSMGALLREAAAEDGAFAERIAEIQKRGELVRDADAIEVLRRRMQRPDTQGGYILDGFPRDDEQYAAYVAFDTPTMVIVMTVPEEVSMERLLKRAQTEGRVDDTPEVIRRRLEIYHEKTEPMIRKFEEQGLVQRVDATGSIEDVAARITKLF